VRRLLLVAISLALTGCAGGGDTQSEKPVCPSTTEQQPTSTTTVDPRCLPGAQGSSQSTTSQAKGVELWRGPVTGHGTYPGCSPAEPAVTGEVVLSADDKGVVTGHATEDIATYECGGVATDPPPNTWPITGSKTTEAFQLSVQGRELRMDINDGRRASAQIDTLGSGGYGATVTYSVECTNCD
jgi:hypothetical protein